MKRFLSIMIIYLFSSTNIQAEDSKVDILLEKVQTSQSKKERDGFLHQLKLELANINKKAREESNAIIKAKKKIPTKLFNYKDKK